MTEQITIDTMKVERKRYLDGDITHADYYLWLADGLSITEQMLPVPISRIKASTDEHFNDIPLRRWDAMDSYVRQQAHGLHWSLSDTVCTLKAVARRVAAS